MLWLALYFPELSLAASTAGEGTQEALRTAPVAVKDGPQSNPFLSYCNENASKKGVRTGMTVSQALALVDSLVVLPRQIEREKELMEIAAQRGLRYTPMCVIESDIERHCILLDITSSLIFFGGANAIQQSLATMFASDAQYFGKVYFALASTPLSAELLARQASTSAPKRELHEIPLSLVPWLAAHYAVFISLGLHTLGEVCTLPRAGFAKRFGKETLDLLDRCVGRVPDPRNAYAAPTTWKTRFEFSTPIFESPHLVVGIDQALAALSDWLIARAKGTRNFTVTLQHSHERKTIYPILTSEVSVDKKHWRTLLTEYFHRQPVCDAVNAVEVLCDRPEPLPLNSRDLLRTTAFDVPAWHTVIDQLHSRLGLHAVYRLQTCTEHRPEYAQIRVCVTAANENFSKKINALSLRPFFLLTRPREIVMKNGQLTYFGPLTLLSPPERLQTGWWDDKAVSRDYFVARNEKGVLCWVFHAFLEHEKWYLHGFFA